MTIRLISLLALLTNLAAAASPPLPLHTPERTPRQLVKDRATAAGHSHPQLDATALDRAAAALSQGRWNQEVAQALPLLLERAADDCDTNQPAKALPLLRQMQPMCPDDIGFLWVLASADLATNNFNDARQSLDELLTHRPDLVPAYLARALAAGHMGSLPRMQADLAIARALDAKQSSDFAQSHSAEIAACIAAAPKQSAAEITQTFLNQDYAGADVASLLPIAIDLQKAANLNRRIPLEIYQDGLRLRAAAIESSPNTAEPLGQMATYIYLNGIKKYGEGNANAVEWENDRLLAMQFANLALTIDPRNVTALATKGWLLEQDNQDHDALDIAQAGLQIQPGYPRFARLESTIMSASGILAANAATKERARKSWMITTPDYIVTFSRGPNADELQKARQFDAMSTANISDANRAQFQAWQSYSNSIDEMNVAAGYYDFINQDDKAIPLWKQVAQLDPNNSEAMENMQRYCQKVNDPTDAFEWQLRVDNIYTTTAAPLLQEAQQQLTARDYAGANKTATRALAIDPINPTGYAILGRATDGDNATAAWWKMTRCAEALEIAKAKLSSQDLSSAATSPIPATDAQEMLKILNAELEISKLAKDASITDPIQKRIDTLRPRLTQPTASIPLMQLFGTNPQARVEMYNALGEASLERIRVLIADNEMDAAARCCLSAGPRNGPWHSEVYNETFNTELPIYQYLRSRLYHYQLWHYFGPDTLHRYEAYVNSHGN